ncbi:hypothetical protein G2W53_041192 [Senna tora]|uniref:Uncharacterized protein n=1 Tax=Senna tora TaxID=362788 RepID=A0A834SEQ3_9FABA|nr:hypothetical protein G2W53_041192 [Senna tora]
MKHKVPSFHSSSTTAQPRKKVSHVHIHYDHQMLLDCLISKDVGISCAKYLLRHRRFTIIVCAESMLSLSIPIKS